MHPSLKGVGLMLIAVIWFVVGWLNGIIFFYPPNPAGDRPRDGGQRGGQRR